LEEDKEICNECGRSVKPGSGLFVNRVPDLNDYQTRVEMGKPFPEGGYVCAECDAKIYDCPTCPNCGEPLDEIWISEVVQTLLWNNDEGNYEVRDIQQAVSYVCPYCEKPIGGWRADGEKWGFIPETE